LYLINRKVVDTIIKLRDKPRLMGQVIRWVGFDIGFIEVKHNERLEGKSSYNLSKLLSLVWDGWISNSDRLLRIVIYFGIVISFFTFLIGLSIIFLKFFGGFATGWSSIIVTILFSTGLILMALGIVGLYVGKIFEQTKDRPLFIVDEKLNFNEQ
jgi:dolichol-phosphate mannosyltransferase